MTTEQYAYIDPARATEPVNVQFTEHETMRVYGIADAYARMCVANGQPVPPNVMIAVLEFAEHCLNSMAAYQAQTELEQHREGGHKAN